MTLGVFPIICPDTVVDSTIEHFKYHQPFEHIKRRLNVKRNYLLTKNQYDAVADPYKIVYVDYRHITKYLKEKKWEKWGVWGGIIDGKWDINNTIPIDQYPCYKGIKQHFINGVPWEKTSYINDLVRSKQKKYDLPYDGCETWEEVRDQYVEKYKEYDLLYQKLKKRGFQKIKTERFLHPTTYTLPQMVIGRDGEFIFAGDGRHRVAIAHLLEINKIPIYVYSRHKKWQKIREDIYKNSAKKYGTEIRSHPDLQEIIHD